MREGSIVGPVCGLKCNPSVDVGQAVSRNDGTGLAIEMVFFDFAWRRISCEPLLLD